MAVYSIGGKPVALTPQTSALLAKANLANFMDRHDSRAAYAKFKELKLRAARPEEKIARVSLLVFSIDVKDGKKLAANTPPQFANNRLRCVAFYEIDGDDKVYDGFAGKEFDRFSYENEIGAAITGKTQFNEQMGAFSTPQAATSFYSELIAKPPAVSKLYVAIDPGHSAAPDEIWAQGKGGADPGAVYTEDGKVLYREAANAWHVAKTVIEKLDASGLVNAFSTMEMYRDGIVPKGIRPPREGRAVYAKRRATEDGAELLAIFSLHNDSAAKKPGKPHAKGAGTHYYGDESEGLAQFTLDEYVKRVMFGGKQAFVSRGIHSRPDLGLTMKAHELGIKCVLLELGFISNPAEAILISTEPTRTQIAVVFAGILINAKAGNKF